MVSIYKKLKNAAILAKKEEESLYAHALQEMEQGHRRDGIWAKALSEAKGNSELAKSIYIKRVVESIKDDKHIISQILGEIDTPLPEEVATSSARDIQQTISPVQRSPVTALGFIILTVFCIALWAIYYFRFSSGTIISVAVIALVGVLLWQIRIIATIVLFFLCWSAALLGLVGICSLIGIDPPPPEGLYWGVIWIGFFLSIFIAGYLTKKIVDTFNKAVRRIL